jgi:short-subunit dehydrogenase
MPGPTATRFFERADMEDTRVGRMKKDDPADVARMGFEAMLRGDERVVAAWLMTKIQAATSRWLPDRVKATFHRVMAKPASGGTTMVRSDRAA